tara:strand:+ start:21971 stop:22651 length:681 start_codon:yes stop_codon:yes gene_type:complete
MKTFAFLLLTLPLAADHHQSNELTSAEKKAGWTLLFDGKSTEHFRNYKKDSVSPKWVVKDGILTLTGKGGGDIITKQEYGAFEFTVDYRISKGGNSGLMFHVKETESRPWQTGPEIQIQDNIDGHDAQKAGWLYQLYRPAKGVDATKPAGEWNTLKILITPEKCVQWMNGTKYVEYVKGSDDWDKKVAASKFRKFKNFGKATKGHLCLQDHGNVVSFKNIKVREVK